MVSYLLARLQIGRGELVEHSLPNTKLVSPFFIFGCATESLEAASSSIVSSATNSLPEKTFRKQGRKKYQKHNLVLANHHKKTASKVVCLHPLEPYCRFFKFSSTVIMKLINKDFYLFVGVS